MGSGSALNVIVETGVIAIMRASSSDRLLPAAEAILAGGVRAIEVAMTTPDALDVIRQMANWLADGVVVGVGTVLDGETARAAILAGADFIVSPTFNPATIEVCKRYAVPVIPGAYTPNEILAAWTAGASLVKVFPASAGGPAYIKAIHAPLPQVRLIAVGGVTVENAAEFVRAGVEAVAVGSELVNDELLAVGDFATIAERARQFRAQVQAGRGR